MENKIEKVLVFGASSEFGQSITQTYSKKGFEIYLIGNRITPLKKIKNALEGISAIKLLDVNTGSCEKKVFNEVKNIMNEMSYIIICPESSFLDGLELKDPFIYRKTLAQMIELISCSVVELLQYDTGRLIVFSSVACGKDDLRGLGRNPYQRLIHHVIATQREMIQSYNKQLQITSVEFINDTIFHKIKNKKQRKLKMDQLMDNLYNELMKNSPQITTDGVDIIA